MTTKTLNKFRIFGVPNVNIFVGQKLVKVFLCVLINLNTFNKYVAFFFILKKCLHLYNYDKLGINNCLLILKHGMSSTFNDRSFNVIQ